MSKPSQGPILCLLHPCPPLATSTLPVPAFHPSPPSPHPCLITWSHTCGCLRSLPHMALAQHAPDLADTSLAQPWNLQSALPQPNGRCFYGLLQGRMGAPQNWQRPTFFLYMANLARVGMRWYPGSLSWRHLACVCEGPSRYFCTSRRKGRGSPVLTFRVYCVPLYKEVLSESYKRQCKKIPWIKSSSVFPPTPSQFYPNNKMLPQTKPKTFWRS